MRWENGVFLALFPGQNGSSSGSKLTQATMNLSRFTYTYIHL